MIWKITNNIYAPRICEIYDIYLYKSYAFLGNSAMSVSIDELTQARDVVNTILDELELDAYIFEVEPCNAEWEIIIECAVAEGWERFRLSASHKNLLRGVDDAVIHQSLLDDWRGRLTACKLRNK